MIPLKDNADKKESSKKLEEYRDITDDVDESDFIPYASHYRENAVLTKNGELLQVIRIDSDNNLSDKKNIREAIRTALVKNIVSDDYAVWISTIRLGAKSSTSLYSDNEFINALDKKWNETLKDALYYNEVFLTIVRVGQENKISRPGNFLRSLGYFTEMKSRRNYLKNSYEELDFITSAVTSDLKDLGARKLGMETRNGIVYSEVTEFLGKIINLRYLQFPVIPVDLSEDLTRGEVTFAYDAMEVREDIGRRRFGSVITIKDYKEAHAEIINKFFHVPAEFVVTQMLSFAHSKQALAEYKKQQHYLSLSGDGELYEKIGLKNILSSDKGRVVDFGESQITVFMLADSINKLEENVHNTVKFLGSYGISTIREDMFMQDCYWAQLPANFEFVKRLKYVSTRNVGGYVNLSGNFVGARSNPWGVKLASFWNVYRNIYNFNFHNSEKTGHTNIIGPYDSGKSLLGNFLLAQSTKYKPNIYYFDVSNSFDPLSRKLGFDKITIQPDADLQLNPFDLIENENNTSFLLAWFTILLACKENPEEIKVLQQAIKQVMELEKKERNFAMFYQFVDHADLKSRLEKILDSKYLNAHNNSQLNREKIYFNIADYDPKSILQKSVVSFVIYYLTLNLKNKPTIFYLDEGWGILNNSILAGKVVDWLKNLSEKNAIAVFSTEYPQDFANSGVYEKVKDMLATQVFMPDQENMQLYEESYGFSDIEMKYMSKMDKNACHFMVRKSGEATNVCIIDRTSLGEFNKILQPNVQD